MTELFQQWILTVAQHPLATYALVFFILVVSGAGLPVAEEIIVVTCGVLVHRDALEWAPAWVICYTGILLADIILVCLGRKFGKALFHRKWAKRLMHPRRMLHAHHHIHEHGAWVIVASRFIPGSRWPSMLIAGMVHLPFWKFLLADAASAIVSVTIQLIAGYYLAELTTTQFEAGRHWLMLGLFASGVLLIVGYILYRKYLAPQPTGLRPRISLRRFTHLRRPRHRNIS